MKKLALIIGLVILAAGVFYFRTEISRMIEGDLTEEDSTAEPQNEIEEDLFKGPTGPPSVKGPGDRLPGE